jgi:hypothetical protein
MVPQPPQAQDLPFVIDKVTNPDFLKNIGRFQLRGDPVEEFVVGGSILARE